MIRFYNPYQFIPVTGTIGTGPRDQRRERLPYTQVAAGAHPAARHDLWHCECLSGRIICSLYLDTPTVVGARQVPVPRSELTRVEPYRWGDRLAIPGNTLKGMIASLAEALSQSTLRVLDQHLNPKKTVGIPVEGAPHAVPHPVKVGTHQYFSRIDKDMVPWRRYRDRTQRDDLTPAELLFGVVEDLESGATTDAGRNLAGRVRFYDALPAAGDAKLLGDVTLRIPASPYLAGDDKAGKLCVAFYFHKRGERGGYMDKRAFYEAHGNDDILPNGRKVYLHHPTPAHTGLDDWQAPPGYNTRTDKQRLCCTPLDRGQTFFFHIDFENLSPAELTLLERALAPAPGFRHRLGLGKPLGLGSVTLTVEGVFRIDRGARYAADAFARSDAPRYGKVWQLAQTPRAPHRRTEFSARYPGEWRALKATPAAAKPDDYEDPSLIDSATLAAVRALGDPSRLEPGLPVRTPFTRAQERTPEGRSYEWFNENDRDGRQALPPVPTDAGKRLPPLYADYADANRLDCFFVSEVGAVADDPPPEPPTPRDHESEGWLDQTLADLGAGPDNPKWIEVLIRKELAQRVVAITDDEQRGRLFAAIVDRCKREGRTLTNPADRIYRGAKLVAVYV